MVWSTKLLMAHDLQMFNHKNQLRLIVSLKKANHSKDWDAKLLA